MSQALTAAEFARRPGTSGWQVLSDTAQARFTTDGLAAGTEFAQRVCELADRLGHHPDLTIRYGDVHLTTTTHDLPGLTELDAQLAAEISALASDMGLVASPEPLAALEIAIDAMDRESVLPFWQAVLDYRVTENRDLVDPTGRGPSVWFQQMDAPRPQRNRIHFDVTVESWAAEQRVADAIAAGGRLVSDASAPAFWVLADAEGNEACVCTWRSVDG